MTFSSIILFIIAALLGAALIEFVASKVYIRLKENLGDDKKINEVAKWAAIGMLFCAMQAIVWTVQGLAYVMHLFV